MRVVIDANALSAVFDSCNRQHSEFKPVRTYILSGKGTMVAGGSRYKAELGRCTRFRSLLVQLKRASQLISLPDSDVDKDEAAISKKVNSSAFNDSHIVAMVIVGKCQLVCTSDKKSHKYLTMRSLYPKRFTRPKIYSGLRNSSLLT